MGSGMRVERSTFHVVPRTSIERQGEHVSGYVDVEREPASWLLAIAGIVQAPPFETTMPMTVFVWSSVIPTVLVLLVLLSLAIGWTDPAPMDRAAVTREPGEGSAATSPSFTGGVYSSARRL